MKFYFVKKLLLYIDHVFFKIQIYIHIIDIINEYVITHMYIYIYVCICMYIYIYICLYSCVICRNIQKENLSDASHGTEALTPRHGRTHWLRAQGWWGQAARQRVAAPRELVPLLRRDDITLGIPVNSLHMYIYIYMCMYIVHTYASFWMPKDTYNFHTI